MKCIFCGTEAGSGKFCPNCGKSINQENSNIGSNPTEINTASTPLNINNVSTKVNQTGTPSKKPVSRKTAILLAIFLGTFGIHKFYLHRIIQGIIYILLCTTGLPTFLGLVEGIIYLVIGEEKFNDKYNNPDYVRPKWQKACIWGALGFSIFIVVFSCISVYNDGKVDRLIEAGKYEDAKAILDKSDNTTFTSHKRYAKLYAAQGMFNEAAMELLDYCKYEDILDVNSDTVELMDTYAKNASDDVKRQVEDFTNKYLAAQEEKSKLSQAKADAEAAKSDAEAAKAEADKLKAEAAKSKADAAKSKADAEVAKSEAEAAKAQADKSKTEAEAAQAEADKSKADAEAAKKEADKSKAEADKTKLEAEAAKKEADKAKSDAEATKADDNKTQKDNFDKRNNKSATNNDTSNKIPSKMEISDSANYDFDYKTAMRYPDEVSGDYVILEMKLGSEVTGTDGSKYSATILYQDGNMKDGIGYNWDEKFVIKDMRKNKERNWVEDDNIYVWGKFVGIETYNWSYDFSFKETEVKLPVLEIYHDELIDDGGISD